MSEAERNEYLSKLTAEEKAHLEYYWPFWARPDQRLPEGDWTTWLILAGRGWGKTKTGAETIRELVCGSSPLAPGQYKHIALVAETSADARDVMVEGPAGILACHPKDFRPIYQPANRRLIWPNGAMATTYNATEPDQLRGPQHDLAWGDELAKWRYMQDTWDQLQMGLRLGTHPRQLVTTTPRPVKLVRKLLNDPSTYVTRGRTWDNADNLAAPFLKQVRERYEGTRLGRQELEGEVLDDMPGALWSRDVIDSSRKKPDAAPEYERIVVAVDPAVTSGEDADETGIVAVGLAKDADGVPRGYVLDDRSMRGTPEEWAKAAVRLYHDLDADRLIAEKNQGGEMVEAIIRTVDRNVPVELVHATRGKYIRAEPVSALYEQGRIHHVGRFDALEDQMCAFTTDIDRKKDGSPDRVDALVWGITAIFDKLVRKAQKPGQRKSNFPVRPTSSGGKSDAMWMSG